MSYLADLFLDSCTFHTLSENANGTRECGKMLTYRRITTERNENVKCCKVHPLINLISFAASLTLNFKYVERKTRAVPPEKMTLL